MAVETERKFLVDHDKWRALNKPAGVHYRQGYVLNEDNCTIRIRIAGEQGYITFKGASSGISRKEFEYEIPAEEARELLDGFAKSEIEKIRCKIKVGGKLWEVDEFLGGNEGLLMAEIELQHEDEEFERPIWVTDEVSHDEHYYNSYLSVHPFKQWPKDGTVNN